MAMQTITAIYDSEDDARQAQQRLIAFGLPQEDVRIVGQPSAASNEADGHKGLWETIKDFFMPDDDDREMYSEGLRRGGYLLTARVAEEQCPAAVQVLEQTNVVDLDERTKQWRAEGWSGGYSAADAIDNRERDDAAEVQSTGRAHATEQMRSAGTEQSAEQTRPAATAQSAEQAIPIVQERLSVGKRAVNRGGVRIRSYVVEEPVHEQVRLREDRVQVERRPLGEPAPVGGMENPLQEHTIELTETAEEAVVAKDAFVTEEVIVRKTTDERTEDVDDTVRHTEVDVEDTRDDADTANVPPPRSPRQRDRPRPR